MHNRAHSIATHDFIFTAVIEETEESIRIDLLDKSIKQRLMFFFLKTIECGICNSEKQCECCVYGIRKIKIGHIDEEFLTQIKYEQQVVFQETENEIELLSASGEHSLIPIYKSSIIERLIFCSAHTPCYEGKSRRSYAIFKDHRRSSIIK